MTFFKQLHVELTSRCSLECPACPRTIWKNTVKFPVKKHDLDIEAFGKFIDCPAGQKIETLLICGDYGDCIYYPNFNEFIKRFRDKRYIIATNGSYKSQEFWLDLAKLLTPQDEVVFGIDGWDQQSNNLYRVNCDWDSIMMAVNTLIKHSSAKIKWQTIVFSFNYDRLDKIKSLAESLGAEFFAIKTHRFGNNELRPPEELVEINFEYSNKLTDVVIEMEPRCEIERVVTSDGYFLPCDWIRHPKTFYKSDLWTEKDRWLDRLAIDKITLDQGLELVRQWKDLVIEKGLSGSPRLDDLCKMKCRKGCYQPNIVEIK